MIMIKKYILYTYCKALLNSQALYHPSSLSKTITSKIPFLAEIHIGLFCYFVTNQYQLGENKKA